MKSRPLIVTVLPSQQATHTHAILLIKPAWTERQKFLYTCTVGDLPIARHIAMETLEWIWIPAVVLVGVFIFALCWLFFKDYTCCPCRNTRLQSVSDDVESCRSRSLSRGRSSFTSIDINVPRTGPLTPSYPTSPTIICHSYDGYRTEGSEDLPRGLPFHKPPKPPPRPPTRLTTLINYDFGDDALASDIVRMELGAPTIDLHQLRVREATRITDNFLKQSRGRYKRLRIITGRGLHSENGVPKIKPAVESLLNERNYLFKETAKGGCLEVMM